ncbi:patatin-like phospholipase family protein [Ammoniphilus sp. CFH 90114]|uniref:patatin-like phospholipase family protein n=1 Tax=Ammoniphilus sp. CFH 90114 TaxID=2493665 RepID=UPI00100E7EBA|nr:patatin-like phospholipase family protein [Ammoniphilus sp. CFH 90114]RXT15069.1 patatin family protein [Ammoniphilus sp. CFH 90114]
MHKPKVGLALGSGGARGIAHIGVIKVLEEEGIPIDYISGSSMGSLVGAFYAAGISPDMMKKLAINLKRKYWIDLTVPKMGFVAGDKIKEMVRILTHGKNIEELEIPLAIVATDLEKGERVVFTKGPVFQAVRASVSIPGIFVPEMVDGKMLVDGGVIDRVPVTVVKDMGADVVIGVDVGMISSVGKFTSIFDIIAQTIQVMEREIFRFRISEADVMVTPEVGAYSATSFNEIEELIQAGERAAREAITEIKQVLQLGGKK